jgi:ATP-dependent Clp protease ATP-binding subunit ClpA
MTWRHSGISWAPLTLTTTAFPSLSLDPNNSWCAILVTAMFERFTDRARHVLVLAQQEARLLDHNFIGTEHILLGLIHEGEGVAAKALESLDISLEAVREKVEETIGPAGTSTTSSPPFTPRAKKVLELSLREALQLGHNYIGTEHMLLGLVREGDGVAAQVLVSLGADLSRVRVKVIQLLSGYQASGPEKAPSLRCGRCGASLSESVRHGTIKAPLAWAQWRAQCWAGWCCTAVIAGRSSGRS